MPVRIILNEPLDEKAAEAARREGISLDELVQRAVAEHLEQLEKPAGDPFFSDTAVISDGGPADAARNHDRYLYEPNPSSLLQDNGDQS